MLQPPGSTRHTPRTASRKKAEDTPDDIVRQLQRLQPNKRCADCSARLPSCVNLTVGSYVCMNCAGIHRELSSRVKSIGHASFTAEEAEMMRNTDNDKVNALYLAMYDPQRERMKMPTDNNDRTHLKAWIHRKYHDKAWYRGNGAPPHQQQGYGQPTVVQMPPRQQRGQRPPPQQQPPQQQQQHDPFGFDAATAPPPSAPQSWDAFGGNQQQPAQQQQHQQPPQQQPNGFANFQQKDEFPADFGSSQQGFQANFPNQAQQQQQQQPVFQANFSNQSQPQQQQQQPSFQANFPNQSQPQQQQPSFQANFPNQAASQQQPSFQANFPNQAPPQQQQPSFQPNFPNQVHPQQQQPSFHANFPNQAPPQQQEQQPSFQANFSSQQPSQQQQYQQQNHGQSLQQMNVPGQQMPQPQQQNQNAAFQTGFSNQTSPPQQGQMNQQPQQKAPQDIDPFGSIQSNQQQNVPYASMQQAQQGPPNQMNNTSGHGNLAHPSQIHQQTNQYSATSQPFMQMQQGNAQAANSTNDQGKADVSTADAISNMKIEDTESAEKKTSEKLESSSKYQAGQHVYYRSASQVGKAEIVKVHLDDDLQPFYTIKIDGREKQTDDAHLSEEDPAVQELIDAIRSLGPGQLAEVKAFMQKFESTPSSIPSASMPGNVQSDQASVANSMASGMSGPNVQSTSGSVSQHSFQAAVPTSPATSKGVASLGQGHIPAGQTDSFSGIPSPTGAAPATMPSQMASGLSAPPLSQGNKDELGASQGSNSQQYQQGLGASNQQISMQPPQQGQHTMNPGYQAGAAQNMQATSFPNPQMKQGMPQMNHPGMQGPNSQMNQGMPQVNHPGMQGQMHPQGIQQAQQMNQQQAQQFAHFQNQQMPQYGLQNMQSQQPQQAPMSPKGNPFDHF